MSTIVSPASYLIDMYSLLLICWVLQSQTNHQRTRRLNKQTKSGKNPPKLARLLGVAPDPLKFTSTGYRFPGGPVMYTYGDDDDGGGGQFAEGDFLGEGGGGE